MTTPEIERLCEEAKELDAKATAGPWLYKHMSVDGVTISKGLCRGDGDWFTPTADDWMFIAAARSIVPELVSTISTLSAELAKAREEMTWISCDNRLPPVGSEVEIATPVNYDGPTWSRDFARFGENVVGEPFNGFCNDNWHCDVAADRASSEGWMWRPMTSPPTVAEVKS